MRRVGERERIREPGAQLDMSLSAHSPMLADLDVLCRLRAVAYNAAGRRRPPTFRTPKTSLRPNVRSPMCSATEMDSERCRTSAWPTASVPRPGHELPQRDRRPVRLACARRGARCVRGARWATQALFPGDAPEVIATAYYEYNRSFEALALVEGASRT